ncbi:hypothetical protein AGMMS50249_5410 [candidate division SR1 bacterium]|nr:hypothetical protein AGMMS50249_5410 [candidate division SR1 bacterium]
MPEEMLGNLESGEAGSLDKVSEEAAQKVQEETRQAKIVAQQLKQDKAQNAEFSQFLAFLLQNITSDELIKALYDTFFITFNPKTGETFLRKNMNTVVVVGLFYPFFVSEAKKFKIDKHFQNLLPEPENITIKGYVEYLKKLSATYHDNIPVPQEAFANLLFLIIKTYFSKLGEELPNEQEFLALLNG